MNILAYQGSYVGHVWEDPRDELSFARSDLEHAYKNLLEAPLTALAVSEAKTEMDRAMDRVVRAIARVQKDSQ